MGRSHFFVTAGFGALVSAFAAADAFACACCSAFGARRESTARMAPGEKAVFTDLKLAPKAWLYSGEGESVVEATKGFARASNDAYEVILTRDGPRWRLTMKDDKGATGSLAFRLPTRVGRFEVDTLVDSVAGEGGPTAWDEAAQQRRDTKLYKEWRVDAPVFGEGLFTPGALRSARARLILHGYGNTCWSVDDFSRWRLEVRGQGVKFSLIGRLETPGDRDPEDKIPENARP